MFCNLVRRQQHQFLSFSPYLSSHSLLFRTIRIKSNQEEGEEKEEKREEERNLAGKDQQTVSFLQGRKGQEVYLVGTAHISEKSAIQVRDIIQNVEPDVVFLELCEERAAKMRRESFINEDETTAVQEFFRNSNLTMFQGFQGGTFGTMIKELYFFLKSIGFVPGIEFQTAMQTVNEMKKKSGKGPSIVNGDKPIQQTLTKLKNSVSTFDIMKLMMNPPTDLQHEFGQNMQFDPNKNIKQQIEEGVEGMKDRPTVRKYISIVDRLLPRAGEVMLHDRDQYMVDQLWELEGKRVVAVVGLAHMDGIEKRWAAK